MEEKPLNVDQYIARFPKEIQDQLQDIRNIIRTIAPDAEEVISYNMPAYKQNGIVVYFAGYKNHIGFYPTPSGIEAFKNEFQKYNYSKGAVQFPIDAPLPKELIERIVLFRINENSKRVKN